jgi:hypothetical protein
MNWCLCAVPCRPMAQDFSGETPMVGNAQSWPEQGDHVLGKHRLEAAGLGLPWEHAHHV